MSRKAIDNLKVECGVENLVLFRLIGAMKLLLRSSPEKRVTNPGVSNRNLTFSVSERRAWADAKKSSLK